jgi:hypothetical protein
MMGGRGDVNKPSWRFNALAYAEGRAIVDASIDPGNPIINGQRKEGEEDDMATSPSKTEAMVTDNSYSSELGAKRQLELDDEIVDNLEKSDLDGKVTMITEGDDVLGLGVLDSGGANSGNINNGSTSEAMEKDRKKRSKRDGANSPSLGSAGSLEEPVRSQ